MLDMSTITIGDEKFVLRFPLKTMVKAEKMLGKPLQKIFTPIQDKKLGTIFPDYEVEDLIVLFRLGLEAEHKDISEKRAEELLTTFLGEGQSLSIQLSILFTILGQALGFFRTGIDIQKKMGEVAAEVMEGKKK